MPRISFLSLSGVLPCHAVPFLCDSLFIIPLSFRFVKGFSKVFLKFFSKLHFNLWFDSPTSQEAVSFCSLVLGARLLYHFSFRLSRGFPKVFSDFFSSVFWKPFLLSVGLDFSWVLFSSACIVYHFFPLLSTPFRNFLWVFLFYSISRAPVCHFHVICRKPRRDNPAGLCIVCNQISGISISTSWPASADFAIPSIIAWL